MLGSLSIIVAQHMYSMPAYPYISVDYATQLSLYTHHVWIGGAYVYFVYGCNFLKLLNFSFNRIAYKCTILTII